MLKIILLYDILTFCIIRIYLFEQNYEFIYFKQ